MDPLVSKYAGSKDEIETSPSAPLLCGSTEEDGHNLMTEIPAILFPALKIPHRGIIREPQWSYTLKTTKCLAIKTT